MCIRDSLDIALYAADKTTLLDSSTGVTGLESISLNGKTAGDYYLKVYGYQEAANPDYTLFICLLYTSRCV